MPWKKVTLMDQKQRFVSLAATGKFTVTDLCLDFKVSRKTGYKWLAGRRGQVLMFNVARAAIEFSLPRWRAS